MGKLKVKKTMIIIPPDDDGQRIDRWLKKNWPDLGFGALQKLLRTGQIRVDGKRAKPDTRLVAGQDIRLPPQLSMPEIAEKSADAKDQAFMRALVIYEDDDIIAINKPSGLAVQGGSGITRHVDGLLDYLTGINNIRPRLVHRLDRDTSGVLLLARSAETARRLSDTFAGRDIEKIYNAIVSPAPKDNAGRIDAPLAKGMAGQDVEKMMQDDEMGKSAITDYTVLARAPDDKTALVEFHPLTGRTHQIRVHASLIGCPLWGDTKYGAPSGKRFFLHARELRLEHPKTAKKLSIKAPPPPEFEAKCKVLNVGIHKP
jgi:23S rRNA pseudouridine955/2504/2580 synthase